jgi:CRISPR-associated protein Cas1
LPSKYASRFNLETFFVSFSIEPFTWLVEYAVHKLAMEESRHGRMIGKDEYAWTREGRIILDSSLIRRFLELLERMFQNEKPYIFKHGVKRKDGLSMCQEITIAKIQIQKLADYCIRKETVRILPVRRN